MAVVLVVLVLSFAYPFRGWFDQRAQISELQERTIAQQQAIVELNADLKRWDDPAYVETVARERLRFVMPGEASFVVLGGDEAADMAQLVAIEPTGDWWERLWSTVEEADRPPVDLTEPAETSGAPAAGSTEAPAVDPTEAPPAGESLLVPTP